MPDPTKQTVSATQIGALLNVSPYLTKWLLWRHFVHDDKIDAVSSGPNDRLEWGKRMQPVIIQAAAKMMNLEVTENTADSYTRHKRHPIGATLDGEFRDLNRGPGVLETKNVDWLVWRDGWTEELAPDHIEAQVQAQMLVTGAGWATIACLVGGNDLKLYHREPDQELHKLMLQEVERFMASVEAGEEPSPLGRADELPLWRQVRFETPQTEMLDLSESRKATELCAELFYWKTQASLAEKMHKKGEAALELLAGDHSPVKAHGWIAWLKRSQRNASEVSLPMDLRQHLAGLFDRAEAGDVSLLDAERQALADTISWSHITRRGGASVSIDLKPQTALVDPPWADEEELVMEP